MRILLAALLFVLASPPQDTGITRQQALGLVRTINTIQAELKHSSGSYVNFDRLLQNTARFSRLPAITSVDATNATMGEYKVSVIASADGAHYTVSVIPTVQCGEGFFSNDAAIIYPAKPLGCSND